MEDGTKLFVGGIPLSRATVEGVSELFAEMGGCFPLEVVVLPPKGSNQETRCAFVRIPSDVLSETVEALNGLRFEGINMPLAVRLADNQSKQPSAPTWNSGGHTVPPAAKGSWGYSTSMATGGLDGSSTKEYFGDPDSPAAKKAQAKAAGRWLEAAEWMELDYSTTGETLEAKVERLRRALIAAAVEEHFYEAASLEEALAQLDPQAAVSASAAAATAATRGRGTTAPPVNATAAAAGAIARAKSATSQIVAPSLGVPTPSAAPSAMASVDETFFGTILSYRHEKHFGFIQCAELGSDAFVSSYQINGFNVGDQVLFNVTFNPQGKPQAQNLRAPEGNGETGEEPAAKRARNW